MNAPFLLRRMLCDFHMPDCLDEVDFDCGEYVRRAKAAHVQAMVFMSKSLFGNCFYTPGTAGKRCRGLNKDLLEEIVPLFRREDIPVMVYYNVRCNSVEAGAHPDWFQVCRDGRKAVGNIYDSLCVNSPYGEYVLTQLCEMAERFAISGFWLDQVGPAAHACYCEFCRARYRELNGNEMRLPWREEVSVRDQVQWVRFQRLCSNAFVLEAMRRTRAIRQELDFCWNGSGAIWSEHRANAEIVRHAHCVSVEMHHPTFAIRGSLDLRYMRNIGKPFELMIPECLASWEDFTINTLPTLKTMAALIIANGGALNLCSTPCPSGVSAGRQWPAAWEVIGGVMEYVKKRASMVRGSVPVRDAAMIISDEEILFKIARGTPYGKGMHGYGEVVGIGGAMLRDHQQLDVIKADTPGAMDRIDDFGVFILPDMTHISDDVAARLRERVAAGAGLIATYRSGLYRNAEQQPDFVLADLMGVDFNRSSDYSHIYVDITDPALKKGIPDMPALVTGQYPGEPLERACYVTCRPGAEALATYVEPLLEYDPRSRIKRVVAHSHPYRATNQPAVILNRYGKGWSIYIGFPIGTSCNQVPSPWLERLLINVLRRIHDPLMDVSAPTVVDANLMERDEMYVLHLVPCLFQRNSKFIEDNMCFGNIRCSLRLPPPAKVECEDACITWSFHESRLNIVVDKLAGPAMIMIHKRK